MQEATSTALPVHHARLCVRACGVGIAAASIPAALAALLVAGRVPEDALPFAGLGFGLAIVTGCAATICQAWLSSMPSRDPGAGSRYALALVASFVLQAVTAAGGIVALVLLQVKFASITAFALSFAGAVTVLHTAAVLVMARAFRAWGSAMSELPRSDAAPGPARLRDVTQ
jgi:hypothetical protein